MGRVLSTASINKDLKTDNYKNATDSEVKKLIKEESDKMDWDYYHACYPVNPLKLNKPFDKEKSLKLLKEWASVWYSVEASVNASVWDSVWYSVNASIWVSVWDSVKASVRIQILCGF